MFRIVHIQIYSKDATRSRLQFRCLSGRPRALLYVGYRVDGRGREGGWCKEDGVHVTMPSTGKVLGGIDCAWVVHAVLPATPGGLANHMGCGPQELNRLSPRGHACVG